MSNRTFLEKESKRILGYVPGNLDLVSELPREQAVQTLKTRAQYNYSDDRYTGGSQADMPIRAPLHCRKLSTSEHLLPMETYRVRDSTRVYVNEAFNTGRSSSDVMRILREQGEW